METQVYGSLREKIAAEKRERLARYANFQEAWNAAHAAGMAAGNAITPTPMIVRNGSIMVNGVPLDPSRADNTVIDVVADGVCGFAWVTVHPGTSSFARWAIKEKNARKEYGGGVCLTWVSYFNQSMTRKEAYAQAFAEVLRDRLGVKAYSHSRMD